MISNVDQARASCEVYVDTNNQTVVREDCYSEVRMFFSFVSYSHVNCMHSKAPSSSVIVSHRVLRANRRISQRGGVLFVVVVILFYEGSFHILVFVDMSVHENYHFPRIFFLDVLEFSPPKTLLPQCP